MLFGLVTSQYNYFFDPLTNTHHQDLNFDQTQFNYAKIIVAYPFLEDQTRQKIIPQIQIQFFNLCDILQARNKKLFSIGDDKQQQKVQLEIDLDNQIIKTYFKINEGVEIISNKEFERTFSPTSIIEDNYYLFLKKNVNHLPQFKDALNLNNIQAFTKDHQEDLYTNISNNLICDLVISNLATSVIIISKNLRKFSAQNFVQDRGYFKQLFCDISLKIISDQNPLFDYI
ncbi:unnamed protein product [Paramecium sonneborni]|uniref:Uncharacterized protein n=1 Tax=Paramecium sonneborni TaxID=65129 RepID=A0A8S1LR67_9CILI|nr:unnamed protein product [Paramecium sonneborni]